MQRETLCARVRARVARCARTVTSTSSSTCRDDVFVLPDGTYEAIVVDADEDEFGVRIELTITAGAHKGDVVAVRAGEGTVDPVGVLGVPARLFVTDGTPRVELQA